MEQTRSCIGIAAAISMIMLMVMPFNCMATDYTVGDTQQWNLGVDYGTWASGKTFAVGDKLVFSYSALHSVMEVSKADYDACSTSNAIKSYNGGSSTVTLDSAGAKYFVCGTAGHCSGGMKLGVTVATGSSTTPSTSSPPTPTTSTSPTKTPPTTSASAAVADSHIKIKDGVLLVGSLVVGALIVPML
jgi:hypothetical protein